MSNCPCGSGKNYSDCCEQYIKGVKAAETAEILMRSRYSAYTKSEIDYIIATNDPATRDILEKDAIKTWADSAEWQNLVILETVDGKENDETGIVEFQAIYKLNGAPQIHHERSIFNNLNGTWFYTSQEKIDTSKNLKIGRNSPCPCGSGKKYKKCCGK